MQRNEDRTVKAYEAPKLEIYGDIRTITQATGPNGNRDGSMVAPNVRTNP